MVEKHCADNAIHLLAASRSSESTRAQNTNRHIFNDEIANSARINPTLPGVRSKVSSENSFLNSEISSSNLICKLSVNEHFTATGVDKKIDLISAVDLHLHQGQEPIQLSVAF